MLHENILKEAPHLNEKIVTGYRTLAREYYSAGEGGTWVNFWLGMCCWLLRAPTPDYSLFCGQL